MLSGVDLNQVRQYNTSLKQYRDKAANINAQIEFTQKELETLCKELSTELGIEVTEENVEQIYNEQVEKINATLKSGNAVLAKIAEEENSLNIATQQSVSSQNQMELPTQPVQQAQPLSQTTPLMSTPPISSEMSTFESNPVAGSVFGNGNVLGSTPLFGLGTNGV